MPVVLLLAAAAILAGVVVVALGRGGELTISLADSARYGREINTAADVAWFRPPAAFLGYSTQATDDALRRIARIVADRDSELAALRSELTIARARQYPGEPSPAGSGLLWPGQPGPEPLEPQPYASPGPVTDSAVPGGMLPGSPLRAVPAPRDEPGDSEAG